MSIDASDFIDNILDEQARRNAAFVDQPSTDESIEDYQIIPATGVETVGFTTEGVAASTVTHPFTWGTFKWGFSTW